MQPLFWGAHAQRGDHHRLSWGSGTPSSAWSLPTCPLSPPAGVRGLGASGLSLPSLHTLSLWEAPRQEGSGSVSCQALPGAAQDRHLPSCGSGLPPSRGAPGGVLPLTLISHLPRGGGRLVREPSPALLSTCCAPGSRCHQIGECDAPHPLCSGPQVWGRERVGGHGEVLIRVPSVSHQDRTPSWLSCPLFQKGP